MLALIGGGAHLDIAQRFTPSQPYKRHDAKHISTLVEIQIVDAQKPAQARTGICVASDVL